jgi:hypothetical protein
VLGTLWLIGIAILFLDYSQPFRGGLSYGQFWLGILFCMIPAIFLLLDEAFSSGGKVLVLFIWGVTLYLIKVLRSPNFFNFGDEIVHFAALKLIHERATLAIDPTIPKIFAQYPGLELLTNSLKSFTGLSLFSTAILLIGILHSLQPVFIFLAFRQISSSNRIAAIGAFVFTCNPSYIFFDSLFSYESLGILFVTILVFLVSKAYNACAREKTLLLCLSLVVLSGLVITHPFSSYMFLIFLIVLVVVQFREDVTRPRALIYFALLAATIVCAWQVYGAPITLEYFSKLVIYRIDHILGFFATGPQRVLFAHSPLPNYERFIDYLYFPLILLLSGLGVYFIRKDKLHGTLIWSCVLYGPLLIFLMLPLIPTLAADIAYRSMPFLFIGAALIIAYAASRMIWNRHLLLKAFAFGAIILIAMAGISLRGNESGRFAGSSNLASGSSAIMSDVIYASDWFELSAGRYNNVSGDVTVSAVFGGYGVQNANSLGAWDIFFPKTIDSNVIGNLTSSNINYLVVDKRITEFLGQYGYYFDSTELDMKNHADYGATQPLPIECISKFDNSTLFNRIYSNGNIAIYRFGT